MEQEPISLTTREELDYILLLLGEMKQWVKDEYVLLYMLLMMIGEVIIVGCSVRKNGWTFRQGLTR